LERMPLAAFAHPPAHRDWKGRCATSFTNKGTPMDKQRVKGSAQQAKGKIKELAGKAVGNRKLQARGKAEKAGGKIRNVVGGMKDAMRGK
jgi:uncharacterized protein YjbJ (UPF0337 family)